VVQDTEDTRKKTGRGRGGDVDNEWDGSESEHEQDVVERTGVVWAKSWL